MGLLTLNSVVHCCGAYQVLGKFSRGCVFRWLGLWKAWAGKSFWLDSILQGTAVGFLCALTLPCLSLLDTTALVVTQQDSIAKGQEEFARIAAKKR